MGFSLQEIEDAFPELLRQIEDKGLDLSSMNTIEMFSRDGDIHTVNIAKRVKSLEAWEIDPQWKEVLHKNLPNCKIVIGDSIDYVTNSENPSKYDLILVDNPLNTYHKETGTMATHDFHCEHFDFIGKIGNIIDKKAIVIFNVSTKPYHYYKWPFWKQQRELFYGKDVDTGNLNIDFVLDFYTKLFEKAGLKTLFHVHLTRTLYDGETGCLYYLAFSLTKE